MMYVTEADVKPLIKILDENLGDGYMSESDLLGHIHNEKELFFAARREDGSICGMLLFGEEDAQTLSEQTLIPADELLRLAHGKKLLKCRSICIAKDSQHSGVGKTLFNGAIRSIRESGRYGVVTSLLWEYNGTVPSQKLHEDNGFRLLYRIPHPWYHLENYRCVACKGRCRCDGLQYILELP